MLRDIAPGRDPRPPHAVLRTAADINRLLIRLLLLRSAPRIEVRLDTLPRLHVQLMQQRLEQLHERTIGSWGEIAAGITLVVGAFHAWTRVRQWQQMGVVLLEVAAVWVAGQLLEATWRRGRLIWAVWRLKRQLLTGKGLYQGSTRPPEFYPEADLPAGRPGGAPAGLAAASARLLARERSNESAGTAGFHPEHLLIGQVSDIGPLIRQLATSWEIPRIEVRVGGLPDLDLQRIQHQLSGLSGSCNCVLGALLAAVTLLSGGFYIVMTSDQFWEWMNYWETGPAVLLAISVVGAGIAGWMLEAAATRLRLASVLLGLRKKLRAAGEGV